MSLSRMGRVIYESRGERGAIADIRLSGGPGETKGWRADIVVPGLGLSAWLQPAQPWFWRASVVLRDRTAVESGEHCEAAVSQDIVSRGPFAFVFSLADQAEPNPQQWCGGHARITVRSASGERLVFDGPIHRVSLTDD